MAATVPVSQWSIVTYHERLEAPPVRCRTCPHIAICQGGTLSGRLDGTGRILPQPSVMCHDHMRFFDVVARRVQAALVA